MESLSCRRIVYATVKRIYRGMTPSSGQLGRMENHGNDFSPGKYLKDIKKPASGQPSEILSPSHMFMVGQGTLTLAVPQ